jgi:hypothetical protein
MVEGQPSTQPVALVRVKTSASITLFKTKVESAKEEVETSFVNLDGVLSAIIEPASLAQEVQGLRHVLSASKEACHTYFARIVSSLDVQLSRVGISDASMLNNIKADLGTKSKSLSKDAAADLKKKKNRSSLGSMLKSDASLPPMQRPMPIPVLRISLRCLRSTRQPRL